MDDQPIGYFSVLSEQLNKYASQSYTPFSQDKESAICVLSNGDWVPGVRVESASYSLSISAMLNAYTTVRASGRDDLVLVCMNRPLKPEEITYISLLGHGTPRKINECMYVLGKVAPSSLSTSAIDPFLSVAPCASPEEGIQRVREITSRAYIPASNFPVACLLETDKGKLIPGVNIEHPDWSNILCAERNALGTAITFGIDAIKTIYLTCTKDPRCSPCGACRQLLAELTPEAVLWMDRGSGSKESTTPATLLPEWFTGNTLKKKTSDC